MSEQQVGVRQIDYHLFDRILRSHDFTRMNQLEGMKKVYEITANMYKSEWLEEHQRVLQQDKQIVAKIVEIEELQNAISMLKLRLSDLGDTSYDIEVGKPISKEVSKETPKPTLKLCNSEGSQGNKGNSRPLNCS